MAKATKKVKDPVPEKEPVVESPAKTSDPEVKESSIEEPEKKDPVVEDKKEEEKEPEVKIPEPPKENKTFPTAPTSPAPVYRKEADVNLPFEERIVAYMESRNSSEPIKINDFLKSLYPFPRSNEPAQWTAQGTNKYLRAVLEKMKADGLIRIHGDSHKKLGAFYYDGDDPKTKYHNLGTVTILASL